MSEWTHNICETCWNERNPDRLAYKVRQAPALVCCFCGAKHASGIYVRHDPKKLACVHTAHVEGGQQ